eukprot:1180616-Rhodomonas_salina.4
MYPDLAPQCSRVIQRGNQGELDTHCNSRRFKVCPGQVQKLRSTTVGASFRLASRTSCCSAMSLHPVSLVLQGRIRCRPVPTMPVLTITIMILLQLGSSKHPDKQSHTRRRVSNDHLQEMASSTLSSPSIYQTNAVPGVPVSYAA